MKILQGAGSNLLSLVIIVLAVGLILFYTIQSTQEAERDKVTIELQEKTNETRSRVNEAVNTGRSSNVTDSLQYLRERSQP